MKTNETAVMWAESAARAGYAVHNGVPYIGVSGENAGFIVPLAAPAFFGTIEDAGVRDNVFRAMAAHALRVGQAALKAKDATEDRETALAGVNAALSGSYSPSRERSNDITESEVDRQFAAHVETLVRAKVPTATAEQIAATVAKMADSDAGKKWKAEARNRVIEAGTYVVSRKASKGSALDISL